MLCLGDFSNTVYDFISINQFLMKIYFFFKHEIYELCLFKIKIG